jgi:hypothetical protein
MQIISEKGKKQNYIVIVDKIRYVTLRYVTLRYVTLRYVTLRYVTLRYVLRTTNLTNLALIDEADKQLELLNNMLEDLGLQV